MRPARNEELSARNVRQAHHRCACHTRAVVPGNASGLSHVLAKMHKRLRGTHAPPQGCTPCDQHKRSIAVAMASTCLPGSRMLTAAPQPKCRPSVCL